MKHWLLFILVISWFCFPLSGQQTNRPDWVKQHPVSGLSYIGIGMAEISEGDYQQKAKQNALSDLVSEIQVVIAANSLLNTLEDDGNVKQTFAESIRTEARAEIENFRLVDSWRSDNEYWVYYELNKDDYAALVEARRQKAIRNGFDFWYKGHITLQQGDLMTAVELFSNGMEAIRPVLNQELFCSYEGKTINLATELYAALAGVFDGITIVLNPATVSVTPFQGIREPIAIGVYSNGNPLRNIRLKAEFVSGSGDLSSMSPTDESGVAALYVRNITSKQAQQEIGISLIDDVFSLFRKGSYAALFKQMLSSLPGATLTVNTAQTQTSAYVRSAQSDIEAVERTVKSLLNNHFFNVVASPSEADIIVTLDNKCRKGNTVLAEMDKQIGRFIKALDELGLSENTIVIFTSDNGPAPSFQSARAAYLRGTKNSLYEGGIRMPFLIKYPKKIKAGQVNNESVLCAIDLYPSLCAIAGIETEKGYQGDGQNYDKVLLGKSKAKRKTDLMWDFGRNQFFKKPGNANDRSPHLAIRSGNWKLLINNDGSDAQLYDIEKDKFEKNDVAQSHPEVVAKLSKKVCKWFEENKDKGKE